MITSEVGKKWEGSFKKYGEKYSTKVFDAKFYKKFLYSEYIKKIIDNVSLSSDARILEAGCGSGKFSICFAIMGFNVVAMDFSGSICKNLKETVEEAQRSYNIEIEVVRGDLEKLCFKDDTFDLVFNEGVVEHWLKREERINVIKEMARVTKKGGYVAIIVPNGRHPLHKFWIKTGYPGYKAPPMTLYDTKSLKNDIEKTGLKCVFTDGFYPWSSLSQWPTNKLLRLISGALNKFVPLPKSLREKFGVHLICIGKKVKSNVNIGGV